jgi:hypothetical protein
MQGTLQNLYQNTTFDIWWFNLEYPQPYYNHDNHHHHDGKKYIFHIK